VNRSPLRLVFWFGIVPLPILVSLLLQGCDWAWFDRNLLAALAYLVASAALGLTASDVIVKTRESVAGLVQFGPSSACLVWWAADGLLMIIGVHFDPGTIVLGNLIAALGCGIAWGVGHLGSRQIEYAESSREVRADTKRSALEHCREIEQFARLRPGLSVEWRQTIRALCNRLSSLPASRFENVEDSRALGELLEGLYALLSDKEASHVAVLAKIEQVEKLTGPRFGAKQHAVRAEAIDQPEQGA
jgi:hypothetical protein